jgi:hypothetical protein
LGAVLKTKLKMKETMCILLSGKYFVDSFRNHSFMSFLISIKIG